MSWPSTLPAATPRKPEKPSILVVDDEIGPRESVAFALGGEFKVAMADRGRTALEMVRGVEYDAVVLDIRMPEMDGILTLGELRRIDPLVSVIMLTGYGTLQTAQQAMVGGANQYLRKPPDVSELLEAVRKQVAATKERRAQASAARQAESLNETLRREIRENEPRIWQAKASVELVHDLSNPLAIVVGYAALVEEQARRLAAKIPDEALRLAEHAALVGRAAEYCNHLAENWRGVARDARSYVPVDLLDVVNEVLAVGLVGNKPVEVRGEPGGMVLGSRYELMRVIQNLLKNAIESGASAVTVDFVGTGKEVSVTVRDNGPGMSPQQLNQALRGGFTTKRDGTGLGLSICRHVIASHGGRLNIGSSMEGGTSVTVALPAVLLL